MQIRELIPVVLLTAIAGFIAGQYAKAPHIGRPPSAPAPASAPASIHDTTPAVVPQGDTVVLQAPLKSGGDSVPRRDDVLVRNLIKDGSSGTYINAMLQDDRNLLTRWPDRRLDALRIWIDRDPGVDGWKPEFYYAAARAFEEWRVAGFPVAMDVVVNPANTNIRIVWTDRFSVRDGDQIGVTSKQRDAQGWIQSAEITIATHDKDGIPLPPNVVFGAARHEVGHALGLGHSPNPNDVMFPFSRATVISAADRATLHLLYRLPPGLVK